MKYGGNQPGEIITFYSYKGGTGRTMALANLACLLAQQPTDEGVLMVDWDLDAPGLHYFFQDRLRGRFGDLQGNSGRFDDHPGIIDMLLLVASRVQESARTTEIEGEARAEEIVAGIDLDQYVIETDVRNLSMIKAGRFDSGYSSRVNGFGWEQLFNLLPHIYRTFAERLAERYRYVLIDSRTGLSDISGICTMLLPEKLVVVFTPNRQSLAGVADLVRRATGYRRKSGDLRPLLVFPLPSRIESTLDMARAMWRHGDPGRGIQGYQPLFQELFEEVYGCRDCSLEKYFEQVQVQQSPDFSFGEEIAALLEASMDRLSLGQSYKTFLAWLTSSHAAWEDMTQPDLPSATTNYLAWILERYEYLDFRGMGLADPIPWRPPLLDLYVPQKARIDLPMDEIQPPRPRPPGQSVRHAAMLNVIERRSDPQSMADLLRKYDGLVVLGDPGSGKTTLLKFLAVMLCAGKGAALGLAEWLPFLLPISAYAQELQRRDVRLDEFISRYFHDAGSDLPIREILANALQSGRALLLLDGLDEVRSLEIRQLVVDRIFDFYALYRRGNKLLLTSRIAGYRGIRSTARGVTVCALAEFERPDIDGFVARWTRALTPHAQSTSSIAVRGKRDELKQIMESSESLGRLAANPFLLAILVLMWYQGGKLADQRVALYDRYVNTLLHSWNRVRSLSGRGAGREMNPMQTLRILASLALWIHETSSGVGLVKRDDLHRKLEALCADQGAVDPNDVACRVLDDLTLETGLLQEREPGQYGFLHLAFEEYLAAVALAQRVENDMQSVITYLASRLGLPAWHEVVRLTVAHVGVIQKREAAAGTILEGLVAHNAGAPGEAVVLAGEAIIVASPSGVSSASRERVVAALISVMQAKESAPQMRRRSGILVGQLGWRPSDLHQMVEIPPSDILYGHSTEARNVEHRHWLGKYPVANVQYAMFVEDGGYRWRDLWCDAGWHWREREHREAPSFWNQREWNNPIFPVVGITWYEAQAYCRWLNERRIGPGGSPIPEGFHFRLPTDAEWERAARGTNCQEYPWGDGFDISCTNTNESEIRATTAVCTYPQGVTKSGAWDMAGDVWEWTWSSEDESPVLKGGSWIYDRSRARCSYHRKRAPEDYYFDVGFRLLGYLTKSEP